MAVGVNFWRVDYRRDMFGVVLCRVDVKEGKIGIYGILKIYMYYSGSE